MLPILHQCSEGKGLQSIDFAWSTSKHASELSDAGFLVSSLGGCGLSLGRSMSLKPVRWDTRHTINAERQRSYKPHVLLPCHANRIWSACMSSDHDSVWAAWLAPCSTTTPSSPAASQPTYDCLRTAAFNSYGLRKIIYTFQPAVFVAPRASCAGCHQSPLPSPVEIERPNQEIPLPNHQRLSL